MKLPTLKTNDVKEEAYIVLPYGLTAQLSEEAIKELVGGLLNDFLAYTNVK